MHTAYTSEHIVHINSDDKISPHMQHLIFTPLHIPHLQHPRSPTKWNLLALPRPLRLHKPTTRKQQRLSLLLCFIAFLSITFRLTSGHSRDFPSPLFFLYTCTKTLWSKSVSFAYNRCRRTIVSPFCTNYTSTTHAHKPGVGETPKNSF